MKRRTCYSTGIAAICLVLPAAADVIYSGLLDTPIATDLTGATVTIAGGTLNPFFGGVGVANNDLLQPFRDGPGNLDTLRNFPAGATLDAGTLSLSTGYGGSLDHVGSTFTAGTEGYLGFKLNGSNHGWMRVVFTNNTGGALIRDWAYDNGGGAIATGNVLQSAVSGSSQTVALSSASGSFTLGIPLTDGLGNTGGVTNGVVKTGTGVVTLAGNNTYTGATMVSAGTLLINGSLGSTLPTTVNTGATIGGNATLNGALTVNGQLSPGTSPGQMDLNGNNLTMGTASTALFELGGTTRGTGGSNYDSLIDAGTITLDGVWTVSLVNGFVPAGNNLFDLFDATAVLATGFDVTTDLNLPGLGGGLSWDTTNFTTAGQLRVVPESAVALLTGLGLLTLLRRRR